MDIARKTIDYLYDSIKPIIFKATEKDPQKAHQLFIRFSKTVYELKLEELLFNNLTNSRYIPFELSNAAGFNKNGDIPPTVLFYLGFDRAVIGTVTYDPWNGNPRPNIRRYSVTGSMVNWMGLPGKGAERITERLQSYGHHPVPLTINIMSTPQKQGEELLRDLEKTVVTMRDLHNVDRFELNISCPNTHSAIGEMDARQQYHASLDNMLTVVENAIRQHQQLYLKVSPDLTFRGIADTISIGSKHPKIKGITTTNTTTQHDRRYIPESPTKEGKQIGGASGNAVYERSRDVQSSFSVIAKEACLDWNFIACGGINSLERVRERVNAGAKGIQIFTPLIFSGPRLVRILRQY